MLTCTKSSDSISFFDPFRQRNQKLRLTKMNSETLDGLISDLASLMPDAPSVIGIGLHRQDWKPFWALAAKIQEGFNSGVRYPTKELRQAAWERFNALRNEARKRSTSENDQLRSRSEHHKSVIFSECKGIGYSRVTDTLFFFDKTKVWEMKARGGYLANVMKYFSNNKHEMLGEHKRECHARIQEIKEQHEEFWRDHHQAHEAKKDDRRQHLESNLAKNKEMYHRASAALERFRDKAVELRDKISSSNSDKWTGIWSGWLAETEAKIDDIESQLRRIDSWIEENEEQLRKLS
jgi:hypothetical protein